MKKLRLDQGVLEESWEQCDRSLFPAVVQFSFFPTTSLRLAATSTAPPVRRRRTIIPETPDEPDERTTTTGQSARRSTMGHATHDLSSSEISFMIHNISKRSASCLETMSLMKPILTNQKITCGNQLPLELEQKNKLHPRQQTLHRVLIDAH